LLSTGLSFAYWASSVSGSVTQGQPVVSIGDWGIPIFTAQEFYDFANKVNSVATDEYYLANNIDFTGFTWTYSASNSTVTFRGKLNGNNKTLSNLTITNASTSYLYTGIFPRMDGGTVYNLTLNNVNTVTALTGTSQRSGIITGNVYGGTNNISNIKLINCGSQGNSSNGVGGLVGNVQTASTILNLSRIKATNLKVFNKSAYVGGLVGRISTTGARVNMSDIDFKGEVHSYTSSGYSGGLIGYIPSGTFLTVDRAVVEATYQNTLVTNSTYYLRYSDRYLGGIIGRNAAVTANVKLTDVFFTGSLYNQTNTRRNDVGTVSGLDTTQATLTRTYYAYVAYRTSTGTISYTQTGQTGQMSTAVSTTSMPTTTWWNTFYTTFGAANNYWLQDGTGRLYLSS